jgi:RHS repeat-associated protein
VLKSPFSAATPLHIQWFYNGAPIANADNYYNLTGRVANAMSLAGNGWNFQQTFLNTPSTGSARLTNNSALPLSVTAKTLTGTNAARFQFVSGNTATSIAAGASQDIPIKYLADVLGTHTAKIRMGFTYDGLSYAASDVLSLQGQTISLPIAQLWLDDVMLMEEATPVAGTNLTTMTVAVTHPYSATFANQSVDYTLKRGSTYAIIYDFGGSRLGRVIEKRGRQMQTYRESGLADTTRQVLTESLNVMGMTWMRDTTLNDNLLCQIGGILNLRQHRFGVVAQETGYYIDVKGQVSSIASIHGNTVAANAYFKAFGNLASGMEHGVLEQMQANSPAVSTVKLLQLNNMNGKKVFMVTSTNFATIKPQLTNYSSQDLADFQASVNKGNTLILPANGKIALQSWSGKGYIDFKVDNASQHVGMIIGGGFNGGYSVANTPVIPSQVNDTIDFSIVPSFITPTIPSGDPVDMATGYWMYDNTDLALAGGTGGLAFKRSYNSGNNNLKDTLGYGWAHNYGLYVEPHSSSPFGLGQRQPGEASALIAASVATLDLMSGTTDLKSWVTGALIGKWGMDKLTNNAASVHLGTDILTFIKLPNGTYAAPPGTTSTLVKTNNLYRVDERFNRVLNFGADNNASTITDADGNTVSFTYSGGKLQKVSDSFSHSLTFAYTGALLTSVTDSAGRSVSFGYDANSNLTSHTDPEAKVWNYVYDAKHRVLTLKNPLNITTVTNVYDALGRVQSQTVPRQTGSTTFNLYFSGYRNIEEDAAGRQTVYFFDEQKHLVGVQNALGQKSVKSYDGQNHVVAVTDPKNNTTRYLYNGKNNLIKTTNPLGKYFTHTYDSLFHLTGVTDPLGHLVKIEYDSEHHPIKTTVSPASGVSISTQTSYQANGLVSATTDGSGVVTTLTQDSRGNPASSKTATAPAIQYAYDPVGRMSSLTDQVGAKTSFIYDKRSLLTGSTDPLGKTVSLTYYADGTPRTITDRKGRATTLTYTPTGKTNTVAYQNGTTVAYTYDQNDNLTKMQDTLGASTYTYDAVNRLASATDPRGFGIAYTRDANGNVTKVTYPGNKTVSYTYDAVNRLKTVSIDWLAKTAAYVYDDAGRMTGLTQFNATSTLYAYDNANRLTSLDNRLAGTGSSLAIYAYTLDANGNRTGIDQTVPLAITATPSSTSYTMNAKKNRLATTTAGTVTTAYTYDLEGQLATKTGETYTFDDAHRLAATAAGTVTNTYSYNGAGNRLEATRNGAVTRYVYDAGGNLLAEANSSNVIQKYYIYGDGLLAMVTSANALYCYHYDGTGHTVALTDASAAVVNKYAYTPFGKITNQVEAVAQPFKYAGKFGVMAEPNGNYYMRARYYDPSVGRFISEDPIGFGGGDVNLMAYVGNNPVMGVDPSGLVDLFGTVEGDLVGLLGIEGGLGVVIDLDDLGDSGFFRTRGGAGGANVGISAGVGFAIREIEGDSLNFDINAKVVSPTISWDDQGFNGLTFGVGPGAGASSSFTNTSTYSIHNLISDVKSVFSNGK